MTDSHGCPCLGYTVPATMMPHEMFPNIEVMDSPLGIFEFNTLIPAF